MSSGLQQPIGTPNNAVPSSATLFADFTNDYRKKVLIVIE